jgi:hypothetical protein
MGEPPFEPLSLVHEQAEQQAKYKERSAATDIAPCAQRPSTAREVPGEHESDCEHRCCESTAQPNRNAATAIGRT